MDAALGTPWEQRDRLGFLRGLYRTLKGIAFSPGTFFDGLRPETPWREAFWYGWLLQVLFGAVGALLYLVPLLSMYGGALPSPSQLGSYLIVPLAPIVLYPAIVLALAGLVHTLALLTHGTHRGIGATLRAICYARARGSWSVWGPLGLWGVFVGVYALARLQQTTLSRAAFALVGAELLLGAAVVAPLSIFLARHLP
jgi:hypothetical protein